MGKHRKSLSIELDVVFRDNKYWGKISGRNRQGQTISHRSTAHATQAGAEIALFYPDTDEEAKKLHDFLAQIADSAQPVEVPVKIDEEVTETLKIVDESAGIDVNQEGTDDIDKDHTNVDTHEPIHGEGDQPPVDEDAPPASEEEAPAEDLEDEPPALEEDAPEE